MIEKLTSYAYDDITQKLDEVIDAVNEYESPRIDNEIGSQFHKRGEKPDLRGWQRRKIDRRGAKIRPDVETTAWKLKAPEVPVRERIARVLISLNTVPHHSLVAADAIIKELGL